MDGAGVEGHERVFYIRWGGVNRKKWSRAWSLRAGALSEKKVCENKVHKVSRLLLNLLVPNAQFLRDCFSVTKKRAKFRNWP